MSVALLLITHEQIAHSLLTTAHNILSRPVDNAIAIEVPMDAPPETIRAQASRQLSTLEIDSGLLILTDLIGSTPYNVATQIKADQKEAIVISGLNLPMLLKLANYRELPLTELADKAVLGGQSGIDKHEQ